MKIEIDALGNRYFIEANYICFGDKDMIRIGGLEIEKKFNREDLVKFIIDGKPITNEFWDSIPDKKVTE